MKKILFTSILLMAMLYVFSQTRTSLQVYYSPNSKTSLAISCGKRITDSVFVNFSYSYKCFDLYGEPVYEYVDDDSFEAITNSFKIGEKREKVYRQKSNSYWLPVYENNIGEFVKELKEVNDYFNRWSNTASENKIKEMEKEIPVKFLSIAKNKNKPVNGATFRVFDYTPYCILKLPNFGWIYFYNQQDLTVLINSIENIVQEYKDLEHKKEILFK
jgi:hypothetical protein